MDEAMRVTVNEPGQADAEAISLDYLRGTTIGLTEAPRTLR